jgi:hypothetical protein
VTARKVEFMNAFEPGEDVCIVAKSYLEILVERAKKAQALADENQRLWDRDVERLKAIMEQRDDARRQLAECQGRKP